MPLPPAPFVPPELVGTPAVVVMPVVLRPLEAGRRRDGAVPLACDAASPTCVGPMPYPAHVPVHRRAASAAPGRAPVVVRCRISREAAIDAIVERHSTPGRRGLHPAPGPRRRDGPRPRRRHRVRPPRRDGHGIGHHRHGRGALRRGRRLDRGLPGRALRGLRRASTRTSSPTRARAGSRRPTPARRTSGSSRSSAASTRTTSSTGTTTSARAEVPPSLAPAPATLTPPVATPPGAHPRSSPGPSRMGNGSGALM